MTKKMTVTLEEELLEQLDLLANSTGKKKAQVVREALKNYFKVQNTQENWEKENKKAIDSYNIRVTSQELFSKDLRRF
jgi:metal-responsive CopG/Arc/MetJ family transcriptional regulator